MLGAGDRVPTCYYLILQLGQYGLPSKVAIYGGRLHTIFHVLMVSRSRSMLQYLRSKASDCVSQSRAVVKPIPLLLGPYHDPSISKAQMLGTRTVIIYHMPTYTTLPFQIRT